MPLVKLGFGFQGFKPNEKVAETSVSGVFSGKTQMSYSRGVLYNGGSVICVGRG